MRFLALILIFQICLFSCNNTKKPEVLIDHKDSFVETGVNKTDEPQLGDIGDLFNGEPVGDPPVARTFYDIDKWNKAVATNDDFLAESADVSYFFLSNGDKIRITDFKETKWGKAIEFRVLNGTNKNKIAWGRLQDFRLIKSKIQQDKETYERGE